MNGSDQNGARLARTITKGPGLVIQGGAETAYSHSGITAIGTAMLQYDGTLYSGESQTLTISHVDREGYTFGGYTVKNASEEDITATALSGTTLTVPASDITVGCIWNTIPWAGEGTKESPYLIQYPSQLDLLANSSNIEKTTYFKQIADLVYDGTENNYTCHTNFWGHYDGGGYTISGINMNRSSKEHTGLFGWVNGGTVKNVVLANSTIIGSWYVGAIAGKNSGTISNCRVESTVTVTADGASNSIGGIAGQNQQGAISGCISAATITKTGINNGDYFGGIVGYIYEGSVKDCLYAGTTITAISGIMWDHGAISGGHTGNYTYSNNYYTAIDLGGVDSNDRDGARRGYSITLGEGVGISGEKTVYDVSGLTAIGTNALEYNGVIYSGNTQNVTLSHNDYDGRFFNGYTSEDVTISEGTFEMPAKKVLVLGSWDRQIPVTIKMNSVGIMTYASPYALDFRYVEGLTASYACAFTSNSDDTGTLTLTEVTGTVPSGEGLLLKGTKNETYSVPVVASTEALSDNLLVGLTTPTEVSQKEIIDSEEYTTFILSNGEFGINWYVLEEESYTLRANSAYLRLKTSDVYGTDGLARQIVMDFSDATGISEQPTLNSQHSTLNSSWYTVDGVKLDKQPTRKGLYVKDGKKVVVK